MTVVRGHDPPIWRIIVTTLTGATLTCLDHRATDRQFTFTLNAPAEHTGQVATDDPEINLSHPNAGDPALLAPFNRLLYGFRREHPIVGGLPWRCRFGGIIMPTEDQGADVPVTRYTAYDPWQLLMSRPARNPDTGATLGADGYDFNPGARASDIAQALLATTIALDGDCYIDTTDGSLLHDTDPLDAIFHIDQATSVGEAWQALCTTGTIDIVLTPLYDPVAAPGKVVQLEIYPEAGDVRFNSVMAWDMGNRSVSAISRLTDQLANVIAYLSSDRGAGIVQEDASSISRYGRWWSQQVIPVANRTELVTLLALAELEERRNGQRSVQFDLEPERSQLLGMREFVPGDYVPIWATRNLREPMGVDYAQYNGYPDFPGAAGYQRIESIPISLDDNGVERATSVITSGEVVSISIEPPGTPETTPPEAVVVVGSGAVGDTLMAEVVGGP